MTGKWELSHRLLSALFCLTCGVAIAQQEQKTSPQEMPNAPSASRPLLQFTRSTTGPVPAASEPSPGTGASDKGVSAGDLGPEIPEPPFSIETVTQGGETRHSPNTRDELYTLSKKVNFVVIPVTVKEKTTHRMVPGLLPTNFSVFENGLQQKLTYFTSDPFFLSAAIIYDLGMADVDVQKINQTFPALAGAFSQYDEASIYTFTNTAAQVKDFTNAPQLTAALNQLKPTHGRSDGVIVLGGPLAFGPIVNGVPIETGLYPVNTPPKVSHILNDAILMAALDLAKRDDTRRKVIFVISDGHEWGSNASYAETARVLLSHQITVYAVATGSSALPLYKQVSHWHLPRFGYDNLLPKYAAATGGEVFTEYSQQAIATAYATAMSDARNQYTLGYQTGTAPSDDFRDIEVKVNVGLLDIHAKAGYYSLPPSH